MLDSVIKAVEKLPQLEALCICIAPKHWQFFTTIESYDDSSDDDSSEGFSRNALAIGTSFKKTKKKDSLLLIIQWSVWFTYLK